MKQITQTSRVSPSRINPIAREVQDTFDGVYAQTQSFAKNTGSAINGLLVSGDAGTGKTFNVKKALADLGVTGNVEYIKGGKVTAASLYVKLFLNKAKHRIVVLDDVDIIHHSAKNQIIPMILGACDLGHTREVSWETAKANSLMEEAGCPMNFQFNGTLIWITNDTIDDIAKACKQWKNALLSRFNVSRCYFTDEQKYMYTTHLCENVGMLNGNCVDHKMEDGTPGYPQKIIDQCIDYIYENYRQLVEITPRIALRICDTMYYNRNNPAMCKNILQQMWK
jgi:hypothetical protein